MTKRILIFGGGDTHLPLIKACKELGYYVVVTDPLPRPLYAHLADKLAVLDPNDYEGHRQLVDEEKIDGLATCGMETPLPLMAKLAEEFGLEFPSPQVIRQVRNKFLMKQKFLEHGVPCAKGVLITDAAQLEQTDFSSWGFPLILKPVDAYSSRGVFLVENESEMMKYYPQTKAFASDGSVIVEEYLQGPQIGAESISWRGKTQVVQTTGYINTPFPYCVEVELYQPADFSAAVIAQVKEAVQQAHRAVELDNCGSNTELIITKDGPKVIEIAGRLGGDHVSSYLPLLSAGVDMNRALAQVVMGDAPDLKPTRQRHSTIRYYNWEAGTRVVDCRPASELKTHPWVDHAAIKYEPGDILPPATESAHRHAFFITSADSREELRKRVEQLEKVIHPFMAVEQLAQEQLGTAV